MKLLKKFLNKYKSLDKIFKATIWFLAITVIDRSISILTQPFINRILSVEDVGVYGVYSSWYSILTIVTTLNLFCGVLEVNITKYREKKENIIGSLNILSTTIWAVSFLLILIFLNQISSLLSLKPIYIIIMMITILGEMMTSFWAVPKRFDYDYKAYAYVTIGVFLVKSILSVLLSYLMESDRVLGRLIGLCIPTIFTGLVLFIITLRRTNFKTITSYWIPALKFNIPLIPHYLANVLLASSDKIMIEKLVGSTEVGLYSLVYTFSGLSLIVFNAINSAYNPFSLKSLKEKNYKSLASRTHIMLLFSMAFSTLLIYLAPEGIFLLGGEEYLQALNLVPTLVVGIFFSSFYFIFSNVEFVYEKTFFVFPITLICALLNIGLNYLLIPILGYEAAAYTTLIGYVLMATCHFFISLFLAKKDIYNIKVILIELLGFIIFAYLGLALYKLNFVIRIIISIALLICLLFLAYKFRKKLFSNH